MWELPHLGQDGPEWICALLCWVRFSSNKGMRMQRGVLSGGEAMGANLEGRCGALGSYPAGISEQEVG